MEILAGFLIAVVIALTGVGAGTITAPILILLLGIPANAAVGTALAYSAVVKIIVAPIQIVRKQVSYRVLGYMLLGGVPGVILGSLLFRRIVLRGNFEALYGVLGAIMIFSSSWHIYRHFRPAPEDRARSDRPGWIAGIMLPIGAEVGFSSSGAGALGTLALLSLTSLPTSQVVGTDLVFGLGVALVGGGIHVIGGSFDSMLLMKLILGGIAGAIVGSALAPRVPNRILRIALSVWLFAIGVEFCYRAVRF